MYWELLAIDEFISLRVDWSCTPYMMNVYLVLASQRQHSTAKFSLIYAIMLSEAIPSFAIPMTSITLAMLLEGAFPLFAMRFSTQFAIRKVRIFRDRLV